MMTHNRKTLNVATNARKAIVSTLLLAGVAHTGTAHAALKTGDFLTINRGTVGTDGYVSGGSYFGMDMSGDSRIAKFEKTPISFQIATSSNEFVGNIVMGTTFTALNSHGSVINGSETPAFDIWGFFGNTGMDYFKTTAVSDNGDGTMSWAGWRVTWNGIPEINMSTNAWQPLNCTALGCTGWTFTNGVARFQSAGTNGASYVLDYSATVPTGDPSGFGGVQYYLHLEGNVTVVGNLSAATTTGTAKTLSAGSLGATRVTVGDLTGAGIPLDTADSTVQHTDGMYYDFVVSGLSGGEMVNVVIPLSTPLPTPPTGSSNVYRKYNAGTGRWSTFTEDASNTVKSAPGTPDACPAAGDPAYTAGLTPGRYCIQLTILNGGVNDSDSSATTVTDPGGIATGVPVVNNTIASASTSGCSLASTHTSLKQGGDWAFVLGFIAWLGAIVRRRRHNA